MFKRYLTPQYFAAAFMLALAFLCSLSPATAHVLHLSHHGVGAVAAFGMLSPAGARVIDPIITEVVQGYKFPALVGSALFPEVPVTVRGGQVIQFDKEAFRKYNLRRAPGAATKRIDFGYLGDKFALFQDSVEGKVPFETLQDAERVPHIDLAQLYLKNTMQIVKKAQEADCAKLALDATKYDANHKIALAGTDKWSDDTSNPSKDIDDYKEAIRSSIGVAPNTLLLSAKAFKAVRNNANIIGRFKYTSKDSITTAMLAALWDLDQVVVGSDIYWDDATNAMVDVWGNNAVLAYVAPGASSNQEPSYGYTYQMLGHPYAEQPYQDRNAKSWIYPVTYEREPVNSAFTAGFLIQTPA